MTATALPQQIVACLAQMFGPGPVPLHEPVFAGREWKYVRDCLDTGWVSSLGSYVARFEQQLSDYTGAGHVVAVANGTAALHVALLLAGVQPGDEVLIPALTFIATANAVAYCGAKPHFVDSTVETFGLDPEALEAYLRDIAIVTDEGCRNRHTKARIAAVVPVHIFGHPVDLDSLLDVASRYKLTVVEDAAEALGSQYKGRHVGTFGRLGTLSFNGNKTVTTGGGGAILTSDADVARRALHLTTTARIQHQWNYAHDEIGFNYRMPNINAALGCAQLEQLDNFIERKRKLTNLYAASLRAIEGIAVVQEPLQCRSNYWLQAIMLDRAVSDQREAVLAATNDAGYGTRPVWSLMHRLPMYCDCPRMSLPIAEDIARRLINLPSSQALIR